MSTRMVPQSSRTACVFTKLSQRTINGEFGRTDRKMPRPEWLIEKNVIFGACVRSPMAAASFAHGNSYADESGAGNSSEDVSRQAAISFNAQTQFLLWFLTVLPPSSHASAAGLLAASVQRMETVAATLLLGALAALHIIYAFVFRLDSDEPQHLHVVWGWTQGQLPYRDFFDNHSPFFAWLCSPLMHALGERADIVPWMRLAMLPMGALCLVCIYRLGTHLFCRRVGLWAAVATGYWPLFFYTSSEFRPDALWAALWMLTLTVLLTGSFSPRRLFLFGLIIGLAFATSMKTTLLVATLVLTALVVFAAGWHRVTFASPAILLGNTAVTLVGLVLVPGAFVIFFTLHGAFRSLLYCLIFHNTLSGLANDQGWLRWRVVLFPLCLPILFLGACALLRRSSEGADPWRMQRIIFLLAACAYPLLLVSFWPLLTLQDYLPATPPLILMVVVGIIELTRRRATLGAMVPMDAADHPVLRTALIALLILGEIAVIFCVHGPWNNRTGKERDLLAIILRLSSRGDTVMDDKGETIFRRRPFYFALESITRVRLSRGLIADDIPERLVAAGTAVVHAASLPGRARAFVEANYLSIGRLSVLGKMVSPVEQGDLGSIHRFRFQIVVPASYVLLDAKGNIATGQLDGQPLQGEGQWLPSGFHDFTTTDAGQMIVFWANAWKNGFHPVAVSASHDTSHG